MPTRLRRRRAICRAGLPARAAAGILAAALLLACGGPEPEHAGPAQPDIVIVTLDTTRADHLGAYGYFRDTSPRFDRFAREGLLFEQLVVPMATTLPTHLSLLTSSHPLEHGVLANTTQGGERFVPAPALVSFAMTARAAGYETGAFVSAAPLKRGSGIEAGFETFDEPAAKNRPGGRTAEAALHWLRTRDGDRPLLLWVHYYDAHYPYSAPPPFAGTFRHEPALEAFIAERAIHPTAPRELTGTVDEARSAANAYDDELLYQDAQLGRILDALHERGGPRWERTAIVIAGDHGEGLCQHGEAAHGGTWHEQLHAPLLMRIPGAAAARVPVLMTAADVLPTLLAQLSRRFDVQGFEPFLAAALGHDVLAEGFTPQPVLSQDTGREHDRPFRWALTADGFKYFRIEYGDGRVEEQLFDLGADPFELRDIAGGFTEIRDAMRRRTLREIEERRTRGERLRGDAARTRSEADPELLEQLCGLGYIEPERCAAIGREAGE